MDYMPARVQKKGTPTDDIGKRLILMSKLCIDISKPIELSHVADPAREEYCMALDTRFTEAWPQFNKYVRTDDAWHIISEIVMNTHCGTHIEFPYHHVEGGKDAAT